MKLNNKGFAITAVLYGLLILFVVLVSSYLIVLSARKNIVDNIINDIEEEYITNSNNNNMDNSDEEIPSVETVYIVTLNAGSFARGGTETIYYFKNDNIWYFDDKGTEEIRYIVLPTLNGYNFGGYYTLENGSGIQIINSLGIIVNNNISGDIELYAYWIKNGGGDVSAW